MEGEGRRSRCTGRREVQGLTCVLCVLDLPIVVSCARRGHSLRRGGSLLVFLDDCAGFEGIGWARDWDVVLTRVVELLWNGCDQPNNRGVDCESIKGVSEL